jgi:hypothetical protein
METRSVSTSSIMAFNSFSPLRRCLSRIIYLRRECTVSLSAACTKRKSSSISFLKTFPKRHTSAHSRL